MCYNQEITGECCKDFVPIKYYCIFNICTVYLCFDGTERTPYCGYGKCNFLGCHCDGGCREGTVQSAKRAYKNANPQLKFFLEA